MRIAILSRRDDERLAPIADRFGEEGCEVVRLLYRDDLAREVEHQLVSVDAVLVWVDPMGGGEDRKRLDALLRAVAAEGVTVSAHPDAINAMGTKEVLFTTREVGWVNDIDRYLSAEELRAGLEARLAGGPRVIKRARGNGGIGVWRVETAGAERVAVHGAEARDFASEQMTLEAFVARCEPYFDGGGCVIDQAFEPRVAEGIVRCYLVVDEVVGFALQGPGELAVDPARIMGLPSPKQMCAPDAPQYAGLRRSLESEWLPAMRAVLGLSRQQLPLLWDADFLFGPRNSYVLCEINVSCITPFPPEAPAKLVRATLDRLGGLSA